MRKGEPLIAVVRTSCGTFSIALGSKRFPTTVNSFVFLSRRGFYDGIPFDQAAVGTYLHGGDPPGKSQGPGYAVDGELPEGFIYRHGVVAMSHEPNVPPGREGSQFFIVLAKPWLDFTGVYAPLGVVNGGFKVLRQISQFGPPRLPGPRNIGSSGEIGKLRQRVLIEKISIEEG